MVWAIVVIIVLLIPLTAVVLDSELGQVLARRLERRGGGSAGEEELRARIASLETEMERLSRELHRLEEGNDFLHRLLEGKAPSGRTLSAGDESD
jgi:cell division protein FtsB